MSSTIEVSLNKIIIDERRQEQIVVLKEKSGERQFPIVIGLFEASSIKMELSKVPPLRPLTHDTLLTVIKKLGANVEKIVIDKMEEDAFHAKLHLRTSDETRRIIDCRPSDALALSVRSKSPVFVKKELLESVCPS